MTARHAIWLTFIVAGCGGGGGPGGPDAGPALAPTVIDMPSLEEVIRDSAPSAFVMDATAFAEGLATTTDTLDQGEFKARFFGNAGPTNAISIMHNVDARLSFFRSTASDNIHVPCADLTPVPYKVAPYDQMTLYGQCFQKLFYSNDPNDPNSPRTPNGLIIWGQKDGNTYLYVHGDVGGVAAIAKAAGPAPADGGVQHYSAEIWASIGANNASQFGKWCGGSYGVMHIQGNSATSSFEMAVAGLNLGFCGAQIRSDGMNVYGEGSVDGPTCGGRGTVCFSAANLTKGGVCDTTLTTFKLTPLGRKAVTDCSGDPNNPPGPSLYPSIPSDNTVLDGSDGDDVHWGPTTTPPTGTMEYSIIRLMPVPDAGAADARGPDAHL
jgi:hypothetical protein